MKTREPPGGERTTVACTVVDNYSLGMHIGHACNNSLTVVRPYLVSCLLVATTLLLREVILVHFSTVESILDTTSGSTFMLLNMI